MIIWMLASMQAMLALMNYVVGKLADVMGFGTAYWLPAFMIVLAMILLKTLELRDRGAQS
jgi:hypothetical protein